MLIKLCQAYEKNKRKQSEGSLSNTPDAHAYASPTNMSRNNASVDFTSGPSTFPNKSGRPNSAKTRLAPRSAFKGADLDEEEDDEDLAGYGKKPKKESLKDLFDSAPPWMTADEASPPLPASQSKAGGSKSKLVDQNVPPRAQTGSTEVKAMAPQQRRLQAKDERSAPPGSRDLM